MQSVEELLEASQFVNSKTGITKKRIDEDKLLEAIQENLHHFTSMQVSGKGYLGKLAFVSSILRHHNLKHLSVKQTFDGILFGSIEDEFTCTVIAEPYTSDITTYKTKVEEKLNELTKIAYEDNQEQLSEKITSRLDLIKVQFVANQKYRIRELYEKILIKLNNDSDAALALTSLFVFEMDLINSVSNRNALFHFDLYDLKNPLDKWFAAIHIEAVSTKRIIYHNCDILQ